MNLRYGGLLSTCFGCACSAGDSSISGQIESQFMASPTKPIKLALVGPSTWERVCVLGPYTNNERAEQVLGFKWDAEAKTKIGRSDGINVLVFVQGAKVVAYTEHPRSKGDFSRLQPRCLPRALAVVSREVGSAGWVFLKANGA